MFGPLQQLGSGMDVSIMELAEGVCFDLGIRDMGDDLLGDDLPEDDELPMLIPWDGASDDEDLYYTPISLPRSIYTYAFF